MDDGGIGWIGWKEKQKLVEGGGGVGGFNLCISYPQNWS